MPRTLALLAVLAAPLAGQCELQKVFASTKAPQDQFGHAVALSGDAALITSQFSDEVPDDSGSAFLFERVGGVWVETQKLTASDQDMDDRFGHACAIDGDVAVVGARYNADEGYGTGSAYVFEDVAGTWTQTAKLTAGDIQPGTLYGTAVAVSGSIALVGAEVQPGPLGELGSGATYVYERQGGVWTEAAKLFASDAAVDQRFGASVAVDAATAIVGARGDDERAPCAGAAYIVVRDAGQWIEAVKLLPDDLVEFDLFGTDVAIDGATAVVGAALGDSPSGVDTGSAYVYRREPTGWVFDTKLVADDGGPAEFFGSAVAVEDQTILVGAWGVGQDGATQQGAVYVYEQVDGAWAQVNKFLAGDAAPLEHFGHAVAIDGGTALIGARLAADAAGDATGAAYFFDTLDSVTMYGTGCPGSGGFVPRLSASGCTGSGDTITLMLREGLGGAAAMLMFGAGTDVVPVGGGCSMQIFPLLPLSLPLGLSGVGPGQGSLDLVGTIPLIAAPATITMQAFVTDPDTGTGFGFSASQGLALDLLP